jgi:thiol:disulfide interchange protein
MRKLLLLLFIHFLGSNAHAQGIRFEKFKLWNDVLAKAKAENKLIFLDAYTTWCGPCKYMQQAVFPKSSVGKFYNVNFINVKMDMEKGEGPDLAMKYGLTAIPTLMFIDGNGNLVHRFVGAVDGKELVALGKEAIVSDGGSANSKVK